MKSAKYEYEIRQADKNDIPMIMDYIGEDWRKGHILSRNRELFEYEFLEEDKMVNMVIAFNQTEKRMDGCLGYIKTARDTDMFDVWGSVWKVRKEAGNLLGLRLLEKVQKIAGNRYYLGIGMNPDTSVRIHEKLLKEQVGKMKHWYCLAHRDEYRIAVVRHKTERKNTASKIYEVRRLDRETFNARFHKIVIRKKTIPCKNEQYYLHRFFEHPIFTYQVYGIFCGPELFAFFVIREDCFNGRIAIRMVDYYGDEEYMCAIGNILPELFSEENVEYIDFYEYGFSKSCLKDAGFCLLEEGDTNIIPNYFAPFVQENIDIWVTSPVDNARFVKGDGDQDRPNK